MNQNQHENQTCPKHENAAQNVHGQKVFTAN